MKASHWTLIALLLICAGIGGAQQKCVVQTKQVQPGYVTPATLIPAQGPTYNSTDDILLQILAENKAIKEELKGLRADITGLKGAGQQSGTIEAVIGNRCLSCHQDGKAQDKGGSFVLVEKDGVISEQSLGVKRQIVKLVSNGKMPPSGKLSEAEVKVIAEFFDPEKKEEKKKP